jgi:predicted nucleic acid-binding protein
MQTYKIQKAYHWIEDTKEIEITSENLIYTELGTTHSGCQCNNLENAEIIRMKCTQIANLIREIEILNK